MTESAVLDNSFTKPEELSWPDFLVMLLHVAAEIEHTLMVQYLYAAYALGGEQVPEDHRPMVHRWQSSILAIAKEEMGHLMTVQNALILVGAAPNLSRRDLPWDAPYYPFPFSLEPLTLRSLACYVLAESPPPDEIRQLPPSHLPIQYREYSESVQKKVLKAANKAAGLRGAKPHSVGALYALIIELLSDEERIPDIIFRGDSYSSQASFDDWGRNYHPPTHGVDTEGNLLTGKAAQPLGAPSVRLADLLILQMASRTEAIQALQKVAEQGEAPELASQALTEPSHFDRFLEIYLEMEAVKGWRPSRDTVVNPTTLSKTQSPKGATTITAEPARTWATLFNIRYRMLLTYLQHSFHLARITSHYEPSVRAAAVHRVFGEMYNLKAIAGTLVRLPADSGNSKGPQFAGPPFQAPFSLAPPPTGADYWRLHSELILAAQRIVQDLRRMKIHPDGLRYLDALDVLDKASLAWLNGLEPSMNGLNQERNIL